MGSRLLSDTANDQRVKFTLNGKETLAHQGDTILEVAQREGIVIPHLCHKEGLRSDGNCRACVVEIDGERALAPSCCRVVQVGMSVQTQSERVTQSQKMVLELLLSDVAGDGFKTVPEGQHGELSQWAQRLDVHVRDEFKSLGRVQPNADLSHPAIAVNLQSCIQCNRCIRACSELQVNDVIGYAFRGSKSQIVFDFNAALGESTCVACGECVQACPTGALSPKSLTSNPKIDRQVDSVCPFCGVGCQLTYNIQDEKIISVDGRDGPANSSRLCVKGRFGFDYVHHPHRLTVPLIRKHDAPKDPLLIEKLNQQGTHWSDLFRQATWQEALDFAASGLKKLRDLHGPKSLAGLGSAKGSNEEAYLFQKLVRTGFGSNNVDHCTRLCHASSVAALLEGVGSGAVSNPVRDVEHSDLIFIIGSNPSSNHPVAASWMKNAAKKGAKIVLADPRSTDMSKHAWKVLQFKPDTDVAMLNAMLHIIIQEGWVKEEFIRERTRDYEELKKHVLSISPQAMSSICGIDLSTLYEVAKAYAQSKSAMILWGMGVSQHVHGTDNVRCLIALASICGHLGKPGSGLHPLRGQNNVQGASDAGLIPMMYPNYQRVSDPQSKHWFENYWQTPLDDQPGYTVVEMMNKMLSLDSDPHKIRGLYIMGENPAMSDPDLHHARHALASLEHLVVQDIFMTETAWLADVVLPASAWPEKTGTVSNTDRMIQLGHKAIEPPGQAKADLWIIQQLARCIGLSWDYQGESEGVEQVYEEMRGSMLSSIGGISWQRLKKNSSITYPCLDEHDPGQPIVFLDRVSTPDGRIHLKSVDFTTANELVDQDYSFVLITGRQLEHWHTGSMTRRSIVLDAIEPVAHASMCEADLKDLGISAGAYVTVRSRRGEINLRMRVDNGTPKGCVFIPFAYYEAAANLLTNSALDPVGKIPEFKYCAVTIEALKNDVSNDVGFKRG